MEERAISEREFVNYFKGLGGYCTYGDAFRAVLNALEALGGCSGIDPRRLSDLLPESLKNIVRPPDNPCGPEMPERDLLVLFGAIKEKCASRAAEWRTLLPGGLRELWDRSRTIDQMQEAGQCL